MPMYIPEPNSENIHQLYSHLRDIWLPTFERDRFRISVINRTNKIELLAEDEDRNIEAIEFHSGRAGGIIEHARGLVMAMPSFHHESLDNTSEEGMNSDKIEVIAQKVFRKSLLQTNFWPQVAKDVLVNRAFIKAHTLPSTLTFQSGYPKREQEETAKKYLARVRKFKETDAKMPFLITHVPMLHILPLIDAEDNIIVSLESKRVMAGLLAELDCQAAKDAIDRGGNWYDDMLVLEYADAKYVAYYVSTDTMGQNRLEETIDLVPAHFEEFRVWEHGLDCHPVVMIPGIKTGETLLEDRYKCFLDDALDALVVYDFLLSRQTTMVGAYYLPSYLATVAENSAQWRGEDRPTIEVNLGGVTTKFSDENLEPLPYPTRLPDADALTATVDDIIQRHTLEDVLFGRVQGSAPAFQVNLRINVARSKLTPIAQNLAQGVVQVMERFFRGVVELKEEVIVDGESITPSLAKKAIGRLDVTIQPKSSVDRNSDIGTAKMALDFGLDWDWIVENILDIENPTQLRLQKELHELEQQQPATDAVFQEALRQLDVLIEQAEFMPEGAVNPEELPPGAAEAMAGGLGQGPFPPGAAPQTIQGGRGLLTENEQPQPAAAEVGTAPVIG